MTTYRKKLIEVALPLEAINKESAREKSIRHGHPSTLHLWWARRPLAACRAVLFASLVDDPDSDPAYAHYDADTREHMAGEKRRQLFDLIEELVKWENSNNELIINAARAEIARCVASRKIETGELKKDQKLPGGETPWDLVVKGHGDLGKLRAGITHLPKPESVNAFLAEHAPAVADPFAGGGSIPLEAQRLGLRAYASDLNPVPVLINKALIEIPPKFASKPPVNPGARRQGRLNETWKGARGLADDVRYYGKWMRDEAEKRIGQLYTKVQVTSELAKDRPDLTPHVGEQLTVIAWLWARTMKCPNPACGARTPLVRSFWVSKKKGRSCFARPVLDRTNLTVSFKISFSGEPPKHTTDRTGGRCLFCDRFVKKPELREIASRYGTPEIPMAVVADGKSGRVYLDSDMTGVPVFPRPSAPFLEQPITNDKRWFSPPLYGMPNFSDLFTARQLSSLLAFSDLVGEARERVLLDAKASSYYSLEDGRLVDGAAGAVAYADAVATYLAFAQSKACNRNTSLCIWENRMDRLVATFGRQALPMVWEFAETNPLAGAGGDLYGTVESVAEVIEKFPTGPEGMVQQLDARHLQVPNAPVFSTDPPYYDNIGYSDLSDFFYIWLRHSLAGVYPRTLSTLLTPKQEELIASVHRHDGSRERAKRFFEDGLGEAFVQLRGRQQDGYPLTIYYAFKQAEDDGGEDEVGAASVASTGWETILAAVISAGFTVDGTWPIRTEQPKGLRAFEQNSLASSIVLSCRPRSVDAALATRREFLNALKRELPDALKHLQRGNIAPVDLAQASIGPGMAVFTRYAKVMEADGSPMRVRQALALINQTLDEVLADQEGEFDADTRWALAWFEQFGMDEGAFGVAETLSKAKNTAVNGLVEAGLVHARGGKVRLLKRDELPADWDPAADTRLRHWEVVQHLIRALETGGETAAADLLRKLGGTGEVARNLAYRLYNLCERKKWAGEALAYNGLVIAWPEVSKLAQGQPASAQTQGELYGR